MTQTPKPELDDRTMVLVSVAKRQWERTFDAISEPLMIIDAQYVVRRANLALADDLGAPVQAVVGRRCHELRAESSRAFPGAREGPCASCPVERARRDGAARIAEIESENGRTYRIHTYPFEDADEPLSICRYRDVTEERNLARQLSHAEKLAAIGRLAGGVAHEINNPLGGILAFTQILQRPDITDDERTEYLAEIEKMALRCKAIVQSLLRFARQGPATVRGPVNLNDVISESLRFSPYKFGARDVAIVSSLAPNLPPILGSPNQLEQILINLLSNSVDAIVSQRPGASGRVEVSTRCEGEDVVLELRDDGPGIPEAALEKLFDPFFTTKDEGKGTGLGLAVTYAIVEEHGGRIRASNLPGGGALFSVSFPSLPRARD
ncbi:MAG: PAS domain-containing protein [Myxococcales bacterium]|nr:PAS domain-containing protein [Myxococcales bacterium]